MNSQKVEQVLKQIFDQYGVEVVSQQNKFRAAIFDLLTEWDCKDERLVLRNAIESNALLPLGIIQLNRTIYIPNKWGIWKGCSFRFCNKIEKKQTASVIKQGISGK